jgi:hypothetical protein
MMHTQISACWQRELPRMCDVSWQWCIVLVSDALSTGFGTLVWNRAIAAIGIARASLWL